METSRHVAFETHNGLTVPAATKMPARCCRSAGRGALAALLLSASSAAAGAAATSLRLPQHPVCNLSAGVWSNSKTKDIGHVEFEQFADGTLIVQ